MHLILRMILVLRIFQGADPKLFTFYDISDKVKIQAKISKTIRIGRGRTVAFFLMSRHMLSHKYVTTLTPRESWRSHVWDINDI